MNNNRITKPTKRQFLTESQGTTSNSRTNNAYDLSKGGIVKDLKQNSKGSWKLY